MENDFSEVSESYTIAEAIKEAQRCLHCKVPMCRKGCPISNDIPEWIAELAKGNFGNAMKIISNRSNLPAVCGRVCGHERQCEGNCVLNKKGCHINIGKLERFVADFDSMAGLTHENIPEKTRGKVAVIGSGPAGLTIAGDLSRQGFAVEIFEMEPQAGGVLMYGIPEYRLPKEVVRREIKKIENLGVSIHLNVTVGVDITIDQLFEQGFDAIFMGTGAGVPNAYNIPGSDHPGMRQAIHFLRVVSLYENGSVKLDEVNIKKGDKVFVVGCGNTAIDAARTALRFGASEVRVVYRRTIDRMRALRAEYDDAIAEGVKFTWRTNIIEAHGDKNSDRLTNVVFETTTEDGQVEHSVQDVDIVLLALGNSPAARIISTAQDIEVDDYGYVIVRDNPYGMSTRKGVFAGGDVTNRPATVVHAMQDAKRVAEGIAKYIDATKLMEDVEKPIPTEEGKEE